MDKIDPQSDSSTPSPTTVETPIWRCFSGSAISGAIGIACYRLTSSISQSFASKPIHSDNQAVITISVAVRTLVVGVSTLATFVFMFAALGLIALGIQLFIQRFTDQPNSSLDP